MAKMDKVIRTALVHYVTQIEIKLNEAEDEHNQMKLRLNNQLTSCQDRILELESQLRISEPSATLDELKNLFNSTFLWKQPISAIKLIRKISGASLRQSKELMEELRQSHPRDVDIERAKLRAKLMDARTNDE